jgi:hypothetical protein
MMNPATVVGGYANWTYWLNYREPALGTRLPFLSGSHSRRMARVSMGTRASRIGLTIRVKQQIAMVFNLDRL